MKTNTVVALCGFVLLAGCAELPDDAAVPSGDSRPAQPSDGPTSALLQEAESFVASMARTESADWAGASLTGEAIPLYRPDLETAAYYELPVDPEGFVVVATGAHDFTIAHWASRGTAPTARLQEKAGSKADTIARYYKLDTLTYAAEDASGKLVSQLGSMPRQIAVDPESSGNYERSWLPDLDRNGRVIGGEVITRELAPSGHAVASATAGAIIDRQPVAADALEASPAFAANAETRAFDSWQALKDGYAEAFRPQLQSLRSEVSARRQLVDLATAPAPTEAPDSLLRSSGYDNGFYWWSADGNAEFVRYGQIPAQTWPNPTSCQSGCGATAWAMLFGWADIQAHTGSGKWQNHKGFYMKDGGYEVDERAPFGDNVGINLVKMEIRSFIKTFCMFDNGATYPGDMIGAWNYLVGRDNSPLYTTFNAFGFTNTGNTQAAVDVIIGEQSPVIIGVGWLTHYPLAHGFAFHPEYGSFFIVNEGWGQGGAEGIPAASWFHGQIVYVP